MGVILYVLISGSPPFYGPNDTEIYAKVLKRQYKFDSMAIFTQFCVSEGVGDDF